jgi:hypothetical protein
LTRLDALSDRHRDAGAITGAEDLRNAVPHRHEHRGVRALEARSQKCEDIAADQRKVDGEDEARAGRIEQRACDAEDRRLRFVLVFEDRRDGKWLAAVTFDRDHLFEHGRGCGDDVR